jgi:hypothetical protein
MDWIARVQFLTVARGFSPFCNVQTNSGAHTGSYPVCAHSQHSKNFTSPSVCGVISQKVEIFSTCSTVRLEVLKAVTMKSTVFWDVTHCSLVEVFQQIYTRCLLPCLACFLTLKLEPVCSSETLMNFYQTAWHHVLENGTLYMCHWLKNGDAIHSLADST